MTSDHLAVMRRNIHERKVLRLTRGENPEKFLGRKERGKWFEINKDRFSSSFDDLRKISFRHKMEIRPIESRYISTCELKILRWMAESQRHAGLRSCDVRDPDLTKAIKECGMILLDVGFVLPSRTLFTFPR